MTLRAGLLYIWPESVRHSCRSLERLLKIIGSACQITCLPGLGIVALLKLADRLSGMRRAPLMSAVSMHTSSMHVAKQEGSKRNRFFLYPEVDSRRAHDFDPGPDRDDKRCIPMYLCR